MDILKALLVLIYIIGMFGAAAYIAIRMFILPIVKSTKYYLKLKALSTQKEK